MLNDDSNKQRPCNHLIMTNHLPSHGKAMLHMAEALFRAIKKCAKMDFEMCKLESESLFAVK